MLLRREFIQELKRLNENFDYQEFLTLLKQIDRLAGYVYSFDEEFLLYFYRLMSRKDEHYVVDEELVTLGHYLIEESLRKREELSPSLIVYFFLEQKERAHLADYCNCIQFTGGPFPMGIVQDKNQCPDYCLMNMNSYLRFTNDPAAYNYMVMRDVLHEITHIYQQTRKEDSSNLLERLDYYDNQIDMLVIRELYGGTSSPNMFAHYSLSIELMAYEQAEVFMDFLVRNHPEYFRGDLTPSDWLEKSDAYSNRRQRLYDYLNLLKKSGVPYVACIDEVLAKIAIIEEKRRPLMETLQSLGISDASMDGLRYNIFLHSFYSYATDDLNRVRPEIAGQNTFDFSHSANKTLVKSNSYSHYEKNKIA